MSSKESSAEHSYGGYGEQRLRFVVHGSPEFAAQVLHDRAVRLNRERMAQGDPQPDVARIQAEHVRQQAALRQYYVDYANVPELQAKRAADPLLNDHYQVVEALSNVVASTPNASSSVETALVTAQAMMGGYILGVYISELAQ